MNKPNPNRLYCCGCDKKIKARLTTGCEVYPNRKDLENIPFWKCDRCGNHVGCHHKTKNRTMPLGHIATPEIKNARNHIHKLLDPIWKSGLMSRSEIYKSISKALGYQYHTANIKTLEQGRDVYRVILNIKRQIQ